MSSTPRAWKIRDSYFLGEEGKSTLERLQAETGLTEPTLRICLSRGLRTIEAIQEFLSPRLEALKDPYSLKDMDRAIERLTRARADSEKVFIFGDYDVDGTTGASLLTWFFRQCGYTSQTRQPDRFKDGYGLNPKAVDEAHAWGATVLVTVDCGITSFDAAARAKELGIDLIVLDHHHVDPEKGVPSACAVIDAHRPDCTSGLKELCGCGVAFYLCRALRTQGRELGWWPAGSEPNLRQHLDLVVMATAADMVPLIGDNHILVRHGLDVLKQSKKPGVRALLDSAGVGTRDISPSHLGFTIGPRINASGRMGSASVALELLTTEDPGRAASLAFDIEKVNKERGELQNRIWDEVRVRVEEGLKAGKYKHAILIGDERWHEGVVGIVASKVTETFHKPAAVLAIREDFAKGSVRSYGGKDVLEALRSCAGLLKGFGGHKYAAGLSVDHGNFEALVDAFDVAVGELTSGNTSGEMMPLLCDGEICLTKLDYKTLSEIEKLGPFGPGNPEPVFAIKARPLTHQVLKGRHLKMALALASSPSKSKLVLEAIWFHAAEREDQLQAALEAECWWAGVPELNRFRGQATPSFRVKDRRDGTESVEWLASIADSSPS